MTTARFGEVVDPSAVSCGIVSHDGAKPGGGSCTSFFYEVALSKGEEGVDVSGLKVVICTDAVCQFMAKGKVSKGAALSTDTDGLTSADSVDAVLPSTC